jgi:ribosomal protein S18 acetylase RimI-like enzyme
MQHQPALYFFSENHLEDLNYMLDKDQLAFVKLPVFALNRAKEKKGEEFPITILFNKKPIGFLALDFGDDKLALCDNKNAVLLRSLSINPEYQGKGIAKIAMLQISDFIKMHFPKCNEIVLSVNKRNKNAYGLYMKSGFLDTGRTVLLPEKEFVLTKTITPQ